MQSAPERRRAPATMAAEPRTEGALLLALSGDWLLDGARPSVAEATALLECDPAPARVEFRTAELGDWDSGLVHYLVGLERRARELGIAVDAEGLPDGAARLVRMAFAVPPRAPRADARSA
ncbi:MAG: hypothetical protein R3190_15545, partial [Thermoanaerobaculia bacterium]|nr:hypothetical protein [Thermoanaerobaculia bacterium]